MRKNLNREKPWPGHGCVRPGLCLSYGADCRTQPVMFHHSSRGLGHDPNKQFASVATDALLAASKFHQLIGEKADFLVLQIAEQIEKDEKKIL